MSPHVGGSWGLNPQTRSPGAAESPGTLLLSAEVSWMLLAIDPPGSADPVPGSPPPPHPVPWVLQCPHATQTPSTCFPGHLLPPTQATPLPGLFPSPVQLHRPFQSILPLVPSLGLCSLGLWCARWSLCDTAPALCEDTGDRVGCAGLRTGWLWMRARGLLPSAAVGQTPLSAEPDLTLTLLSDTVGVWRQSRSGPRRCQPALSASTELHPQASASSRLPPTQEVSGRPSPPWA